MNRSSIFLLLFACCAHAQDPADFLKRAAPWTDEGAAVSDSLSDVIFHNGLYLAASETNNVFTSPNGIDWVAAETGISGYAIAAGADGYMVVGARWDEEAGKAVAAAAHSPDGAQWTLEDLPAGLNWLTGVAFGNDAWLAVGREGVVLRKQAGGQWEKLDPGFLYTNTYFSGLAFGEGTFIATTIGSLLRSTDNGSTWREFLPGDPRSQIGIITGIEFQEGVFVATGHSVAHSRDGGRNWTTAVGFGDMWVRSASYDGVYFFAVARESVDGAYKRYDCASVDGVHWTKVESDVQMQQNGVAQGSGRLVAVGTSGLRVSSPYLSQAEAWLREHLTNAPAERWTFAADPDQDGLPNLAEYAFGSLPSEAASTATLLLKRLAGGESRSVEWTLRSDDPTLGFTCYHSADLSHWMADTLSFDEESAAWKLVSEKLILESATQDADGLWRLSILPKDPEADIFIRLGVEQLPIVWKD